ncbi:MAG: hypothetical protein IT553_03060 [Sphingomonadaceae bacterium]|nr:hypothetical protein [Sphingomonadaceae bacterium]
MIRIVALGLTLIATSSTAFAEPVYMQCSFLIEGRDYPIEVTADEAAGSVSVFVPSTGHTERLPGTFTPDRLVFSNRMLSYVISRVDLSIERTITSISSTQRGQCQLQQPPRRQF